MSEVNVIDLRDMIAWATAVIDVSTCDSTESKQRAETLARKLRARAASPIATLRSRFAMTENVEHVVWLLTALELDPELRAIPRFRAGISADVIIRIVYGPPPRLDALNDLGAQSVLRRYGLIEATEPRGHDRRQTWVIAPRVFAWLHGDDSMAPELSKLARVVDTIPVDTLAIRAEAVASAREAVTTQNAVVVASGMPGLGRRSLLVAAASEAGHDVLEVDAKRLAKDPDVLARELRLIARECRLLARVPLLRNVDSLVDEKDSSRVDLVGSELATEIESAVLVTCGLQRPQLRWGRSVIVVDVPQPSAAQRAALWRTCLRDAAESDGDHLASRYPLAPALIHDAACTIRARAVARAITPDDVSAGIRAVLDDRLGAFARPIDVTQTWDDLVVGQDQAMAIAELVARIRQRRRVYEQWGFAAKVGKGLGVSALFSGPPGTGKTMVAALIAKDLGLEVYQVDLGKLVSKWIGETEKQLGELFDAAEASQAILLFDEADSLFGKRTEMKSSNDRYANLETNYLLQRLESFTGICLLTSNHESNIDPAFQRRLSLHLRFDLPGEHEREALWRAMLPNDAPVAPNLDFASLARRFEMAGGHIRNAALRAAFLAADEESSISDTHLEYAARVEYEGMGKMVTPASSSRSSSGWPATISSTL
jgi:AAA+ superfamily predicted ATPase